LVASYDLWPGNGEGYIQVSALHKFVTYLLTQTLTHLLTATGPIRGMWTRHNATNQPVTHTWSAPWEQVYQTDRIWDSRAGGGGYWLLMQTATGRRRLIINTTSQMHKYYGGRPAAAARYDSERTSDLRSTATAPQCPTRQRLIAASLHQHTYSVTLYIYLYSRKCLRISLFLLCSLCTGAVLSWSAPNLACGIFISFARSCGLASAAQARGLALRMPELAGATDRR